MDAAPLTLNGLLQASAIDLREVLVMRHRPYERALNNVFDWIVAERRDLFDCYQSTHAANTEAALRRARYLASFIRYRPKLALFVGLYAVAGQSRLTIAEYQSRPQHRELVDLGMAGLKASDGRDSLLEFQLVDTGWNGAWSQRLIANWPGSVRSWYRWGDRNVFAIEAIAEEPLLIGKMPSWETMVLDRAQIALLPGSWRQALAQWRGIYLIIDRSDGKQYVGSAAGQDNILQRWRSYAANGHGGNKRLRQRDPANFLFSILQLVSPTLVESEVCALEASWKRRLMSRAPDGLNEN